MNKQSVLISAISAVVFLALFLFWPVSYVSSYIKPPAPSCPPSGNAWGAYNCQMELFVVKEVVPIPQYTKGPLAVGIVKEHKIPRYDYRHYVAIDAFVALVVWLVIYGVTDRLDPQVRLKRKRS